MAVFGLTLPLARALGCAVTVARMRILGVVVARRGLSLVRILSLEEQKRGYEQKFQHRSLTPAKGEQLRRHWRGRHI